MLAAGCGGVFWWRLLLLLLGARVLLLLLLLLLHTAHLLLVQLLHAPLLAHVRLRSPAAAAAVVGHVEGLLLRHGHAVAGVLRAELHALRLRHVQRRGRRARVRHAHVLTLRDLHVAAHVLLRLHGRTAAGAGRHRLRSELRLDLLLQLLQ